jgi:dUTP pyrophosphatase
MKVKIKKLVPEAVIPRYAKPGDAAVDLVATDKYFDGHNIIFSTGLSIEVPEGHVALIFPRSSICNTELSLSNAVGVIDSGYRGEIKAVFRSGERPRKNYEVGDRICQLMIIAYPNIEFEETQELSETERGIGGFGSTGK